MMNLVRKCSPPILLVLCILVTLSFMYNLMFHQLLSVGKEIENDDLSWDIQGHDAMWQRKARSSLQQNTRVPPKPMNPFKDGENRVKPHTQDSTQEQPHNEDLDSQKTKGMKGAGEYLEAVEEVISIRMSLLQDALDELNTTTKDLHVDSEIYNKVIKSKNYTLLCPVFIKEGKLQRYSIPRIWSDTGFYNQEDVTLVTQITIEKLGTLSELLTHWPGPVSCAMYLDKGDMKRLPSFISRFPNILKRENLDFHLSVKSGNLYPINNLRNLALNYSYTDFVLLMDVDFMPSYGMYDYLLNIIPGLGYLKSMVLVIPAMEFIAYAGYEFPKNKDELLDLWSLKIVASSEEVHWLPSHRPTNYSIWRYATKPYRVDYVEGYEPYIVGKKDLLPRYNESFLSGFRDKIQQIIQVHALGFTFTVIPDHFAVHIPHNRETRPPFYECSIDLYKDFLNLLINTGQLKNGTEFLQKVENATRTRRKVYRRIVRKIVRRKVQTQAPPRSKEEHDENEENES